MMRVGRILRDYSEAGAINAQIALWGFVDDETFLTKAGHVGLVYRIHGQDAEGLTHDQRRQLVHQMEAALRLLDERCRVYQYVLRQEAAGVGIALDIAPLEFGSVIGRMLACDNDAIYTRPGFPDLGHALDHRLCRKAGRLLRR